jgi:hypothetical protein
LLYLNHGVKAAKLRIKLAANDGGCPHDELNSGLERKFVQGEVAEEAFEGKICDLLNLFSAENQNRVWRSLTAVVFE